jgi:hypothetical protein
VVNRFQVRALRTGSRLMGGETRLRDMLGAPPGAFLRWQDGAEPMPERELLMLIEFLADMECEALPPG